MDRQNLVMGSNAACTGGVAPRPAALALIGNMVGALATAGRVDGGQDVWLPLVMIAVLTAIVVAGAGRWSVRIAPAPG
jgi:uncharacterized membrane protein YphA (DoxX/SURF4 family)